jgi:hypothetical protein
MSAFSDSEELSRNKGLSQIYITYTPRITRCSMLLDIALTSNAHLWALQYGAVSLRNGRNAH